MPPYELSLRLLEGLTPYRQAHALQLEAVERLRAKACPETLFLLEHPPVITLGKSARPEDVIASRDKLEAIGVEVHAIERGGQTTYHGPGQIVGYPIIDLRSRNLGVERYVANLEETIIRAASELGVEAFRRKGETGVFCAEGKIGAIGVRVTSGIAFHGFSFNISPNLDHFRLIVPCGTPDLAVASIASVTGISPPIPEAKRIVLRSFLKLFC